MSDRFTQATSELTERNPYICESCETEFGHAAIMHLQGDPGKIGHHSGPVTLKRLVETNEFDSMPFGD